MKPEPKAEPIAPTPEAQRRHRYELGTVWDRTPAGLPALMGKAYRRRPHFESLSLTPDALRALRFYRRQFDVAERSETPCALNLVRGSGGDGIPSGIAYARRLLAVCEEPLSGPPLLTIRAVALHDASFSLVALHRFGSPLRLWPRPERIAPHARARARIAREFGFAVAVMTHRLAPFLRTGD